MTTLLAYVRKSQYDAARDTDRDAVARRRLAIQQWADTHGPFEVRFFEDLDFTGKYEAGRAGWADLVGSLDDPGVWGVIVEDWRDSHRNVKEFLTFYDDHLAPRRLRIVCLQHQNLDPSTADGRMLITQLMAINEWEARKSGERRAAAIKFKVEVQGRHFGPNPFACARDDTKNLIPSPTAYFLDPDTGDAWRADDLPVPARCELRYFYDALHTLFTIYTTGVLSIGDLAHALNLAGWRNWESDYATPVPWHRGSVYSVLKHWYLYAGWLAPYQRATAATRPTQQAAHAPLLPVELCEAAAATLARRHVVGAASKPANPAAAHDYILTGILYCAECGQHLSGKTSGKYYYYHHSYNRGWCSQAMVPARPLERKILEGLKIFATQTDFRNDILDTIRTAVRLTAAEDANHSALLRLEAARQENSRLIDLYTSGLITKFEFAARREALAAEIARLENETVSHPARVLADEETVQAAMAQFANVQLVGPLLQKSTLQSVLARIEMRDGQISSVIPHDWAMPLFEACRLYAGLESGIQSTKIPIWLTLPS